MIEIKGEGEMGQVNTVGAHYTAEIGFAGLESGQLKIYDLKSGSQIKSLVGHNGGVTVIETNNLAYGNQFLTAGNDGIIKVWDMRKYECQDQLSAHKIKYEEGVLALCGINSLNMVATGIFYMNISKKGGADAAINLYEIGEKI